jgi:hypothetical protein
MPDLVKQPKFRCDDAEAELLASAAKMTGKTVSAFVKSAALDTALVMTSGRAAVTMPLPRAYKRVARNCPTAGCIWREFGNPLAVCPTHGHGADL